MRRLALLMLAATACDVDMRLAPRLAPEEIRARYDALSERAVHFRDPRTGLCYAHFPDFGGPPTAVECTESVLALLANPEAADAADVGADPP